MFLHPPPKLVKTKWAQLHVVVGINDVLRSTPERPYIPFMGGATLLVEHGRSGILKRPIRGDDEHFIGHALTEVHTLKTPRYEGAPDMMADDNADVWWRCR